MGIPWAWEAEFMEIGTGMVDKKWEGNGSLQEIFVSRALIIFLALYFSMG